MHQHPDDFHHEDLDGDDEDLEELGTPLYQGSGLSVRALTAEELQRFLDAHADQPVRGGWGAARNPPPCDRTRSNEMRRSDLVPTAAEAPQWGPRNLTGPAAAGPVEPVTGGLGRPGRSALVQYRRRRAEELARWVRSLVWRAPVVAAGLVAGALAAQAGLPSAGLAGVAVAALAGWRLRFRVSEQARAWQRGAHGEQQTARLLDSLGRDGYVVFHDLAMSSSPANADHLVLGPSGVFVIDSKQWTGQVHQSPDGLVWHNHYRLDRILGSVRWEAETIGRLLGIPAAPLVCVHGAHVQGGGLHAQGVAIVPAFLLRSALGFERVLSDVDVERYAASARRRLRPAA
jgi:hypothetical protein